MNDIVLVVPCPPTSPVRVRLGGGQPHASTVERDLHNWLRNAFDMYLQPTNVKIRIANPDGDGTIEVDHPVLMPVDLVQEIWDTGPALFQRSMVGPRGGQTVKDFWSATRDSDWVKSHPHLKHDDLSTTIPLWIHGDMARVYKVQKLLILSWMSSLVSGCSWNSR